MRARPIFLSEPVRGQRPEIQALRAFAVLAVVLNHLWPGRFSGGYVGVDVFFVISGFLITSHLFREAFATGRVDLGAFWARRARRLLPASLLVLVVSALGVLVLVPMAQWQSALAQIIASALYVVNWVLLAQAADYFTSAASPSPVTHFWSLSVEEQFYLVWPLLLIVAVYAAVRLRRSRRAGAVTMIALVTAASLAYSVVLTYEDRSSAYFSTLTRAWEFGLGGLLALVLGGRVLIAAAPWVSWTGWALLGASIWFIDESTPFPGYAALLPVLATVLVIASGSVRGDGNLNMASAFAPVQFMGGISYSLYLWHWPLIILIPFVVGHDLGNLWRIGILGLSVFLAWLSRKFVEDPFRSRSWLVSRRPRVTFLAVAIATGVVAAGLVVPLWAVDVRRDAMNEQLSALAFSGADCFGAAAVGVDACSGSHILRYPDALLATNEQQGGDVPGVNEVCSTSEKWARVRQCELTPVSGDVTRTVTLIGDSHALHYIAALRKLVATDGWSVKTVIQTGCMPIAFDPRIVALWDPSTAPGCREWADQAVAAVAADTESGTIIFSSISREYGYSDGTPSAQQDISVSYQRTWAPWLQEGKKILVVADTAFLQRGDILSCLGRAHGSDAACANSADVVFAKADPMVTAAQEEAPGQVRVFDPNDFICVAGQCHAVVGGVPVFVDHNHLFQAFSMTLARPIARAVAELDSQR